MATAGRPTAAMGFLPRGGLLNAIEATVIVAFGGILVAIPPGLGAGIYLALSDKGRVASTIRFTADVLTILLVIRIESLLKEKAMVINHVNPI